MISSLSFFPQSLFSDWIWNDFLMNNGKKDGDQADRIQFRYQEMQANKSTALIFICQNIIQLFPAILQ